MEKEDIKSNKRLLRHSRGGVSDASGASSSQSSAVHLHFPNSRCDGPRTHSLIFEARHMCVGGRVYFQGKQKFVKLKNSLSIYLSYT